MRYILAMTGTAAGVVYFTTGMTMDGMTVAIVGVCVLCTVVIGAFVYTVRSN